MTVEPKLEAYLSELDKALGQIPVSDRADIITEIKSYVIDAQQKNPTQSLNAILNSLGEPEVVAKRYLDERGLRVVKPTTSAPPSMMWLSSAIKWLVIGFLSFVLLITIVVGLLIWKFTPLISVDEATNRVSIGGGLIQIHDTNGEAKSYFKNIQQKPEQLNDIKKP